MAANRDDALLSKLQHSINSWSGEVTDAHQQLTNQISETKAQLNSLMDVIAARKKGRVGTAEVPTADPEGAARQAIALREAVDHGADLQRDVGYLQAELEEVKRSAAEQRQVSAALTRENGVLKTKERIASSAIDAARSESQSLKALLESATKAKAESTLELESLRAKVSAVGTEESTLREERDALLADLVERESERDALRAEAGGFDVKIEELGHALKRANGALGEAAELNAAQIAQLEKVEADMEGLRVRVEERQSEVLELREQLNVQTRVTEQLRETEEALVAEIAQLRGEAEGKDQALASAQEELAGIRGQFEEQERELRRAFDEAERLRAHTETTLVPELAALRAELAAKAEALSQLEEGSAARSEEEAGRSEVEEALREEVAQLRRDNDSLGRAAQSRERELTSLGQEYERQALALTDAVKEVEQHWQLASEAEQRDKVQSAEINAAERELEEKSAALVASQMELHALREEYEEGMRERSAELDALRAEAERDLGSMRESLQALTDESGVVPAAESADVEALRTRMEELSKENTIYRGQIGEMERQLTMLPEQGAAAEGARADLDDRRADLMTFEATLNEREAAVDMASEKIAGLEETARAMQAEVATMRAEYESAMEGVESGDDADALARSQSTINALRLELANRNEAVSRLEAERSDAVEAAPVGSSGEVESSQRLLRVLEEVESLKEQLVERETIAEDGEAGDASRIAFAAYDGSGRQRSMGEILVNAGIVSQGQLESALEEQRTAKQRRLGSILVEKGLIREEIVAQVVASQLKLAYVRLEDAAIESAAVSLLNGRLATHHMCFPIAATSEELTIAMANPLDLIAIEDLGFATHLKIRPVVATLADITSAIVRHYGVSITPSVGKTVANAASRVVKPFMMLRKGFSESGRKDRK